MLSITFVKRVLSTGPGIWACAIREPAPRRWALRDEAVRYNDALSCTRRDQRESFGSAACSRRPPKAARSKETFALPNLGELGSLCDSQAHHRVQRNFEVSMAQKFSELARTAIAISRGLLRSEGAGSSCAGAPLVGQNSSCSGNGFEVTLRSNAAAPPAPSERKPHLSVCSPFEI